MNIEKVRDLLALNDEEIGWLERRKTGELTPRQTLLVSEIQTRAMIYDRVPAGPTRDDLVAISLGLRDEALAADFERMSMAALNSINERIVRLNMRIAKEHPTK